MSLHFLETHFTQQIPFQILPVSLVSYSIDYWTNCSWQDLEENITSKKGIWIILRKPLLQDLPQQRFSIYWHTQQHLKTMENNCISGLCSILTCCFCSEQDFEVSKKDNKPDNNQIDYIGDISLLDDVGISKDCFSEAKHTRIIEIQWFYGQGDEEIRKNRQHAGHPN